MAAESKHRLGPTLRYGLFFAPAWSKSARISSSASISPKKPISGLRRRNITITYLDLEGDLAYLSALILVFVESAGSIAELGAFCQTPVLNEKLFAVIEHRYQDEESFIKDGPVAKLKQLNNESVFFLPWSKPPKRGRSRIDKKKAQETVGGLLNWLSGYMAKLPQEEKFREDNIGHLLLLIADFVALGTIVRHGEIESYLKGLVYRFIKL